MFDDKFEGVYATWGSGPPEPCNCCGARLRKTNSKVDLRRSNNINLQAVESEHYLSKDEKREIVCIQTSNGPLTIGMRYAW
jgi:hypothetical protein